MRVVLAGLVLAASAASLIVFAACSEETATTPGDGGVPTSTSSSSGSSDTDADNGEDRDADDGIKYAPNGCPLTTTKYISGKKVENVQRVDIPSAVEWENLEGALSEDGKFATVTLDDGQESAELRVSDFGLNVPPNAETWGIEVELKRRAPDGGIRDVKVDVFIAGKTTGWKYYKDPWPRNIVGTHHYGQAVDTWNVELFPSDVNKETFAALLWVKKDGDAGIQGPVTAYVDALKVAVWYCDKK